MKIIACIAATFFALNIGLSQKDSSYYFIGNMNDTTYLIFPRISLDSRGDAIKITTTIASEIDSLKKRILPNRFQIQYPKEFFEKQAFLRKIKHDSLLNALTNAPVPDFDAPDTEGVVHRPSSYQGRVLILHFWNFWDYSFDNEIPILNEMVEKYHSQGLEILSFTDLQLGESEKNYMKKHPIRFPLIENSRTFMRQFLKLNYYSIPYLIIVDRRGNMRYFYIDNELNKGKKRMMIGPNGDPVQTNVIDPNDKLGIEEKVLSLLKEI